jgi:hypothetical protein
MFGIVVWFEYLYIDVAGSRIRARYCNYTVSPLDDATGALTLKCRVDASMFVSPPNGSLHPLPNFHEIWYAL